MSQNAFTVTVMIGEKTQSVSCRDGAMCAAAKLRVTDSIGDRVWFAIPQATEGQRIGDYCCDCGFNGRMLMER